MPSITRRLRNAVKRGLYQGFRVGQYCGLDILPRHFYSTVPDHRELHRRPYWRTPMSMVGVQGTDVESQLRFVAECYTPVVRDRLAKFDVHGYAASENGEMGYGPVEAAFLYGFIFTRRPPRVVQVGAGVSTAVVLRAAQDAGYAVEVTCVDPFPTGYLTRLAGERKIKLLAEPAQEIDLEVLTGVGEGDLFFVDSTHTVKVGSEVNRIVLEVLPRLVVGTSVHFHDIFFPYDYGRSLLLESLSFNGESTLLHAFLACNPRYTISAAMSMLHYAAPERLREIIPSYQPQANDAGLMTANAPGHFPSAAYLRVVA